MVSKPLDVPTSTTNYMHIGAYEAIPFEHILMHPTTSITNAYIIRKALIRKHYLSNTVYSWTAKNPSSILATNVKPSCSFELDYAEFLDDALVEAWELRASFDRNKGKPRKDREWWILKPGMSDRGQGIRLFSSEQELQEIFEQWEADRSDSEDGSVAELEDDDNIPEQDHQKPASDYIVTSHLRHFVAQPYIHDPLLLPEDPRKFHVRTYVLALGALKIFVYRPMLALFASTDYTSPWHSGTELTADIDLAPHLTNTCLQEQDRAAPGSTSRPAVRLLSTLDFSHSPASLASIEKQILALTAEIFEAAARTQTIHFQTLPNAFEVFGLDFLIDASGTAWLLECNAFPDFRQTGPELRSLVQGFWDDVVGQVKRWWDVRRGSVSDGASPTEHDDTDLVLVRELDLGRT